MPAVVCISNQRIVSSRRGWGRNAQYYEVPTGQGSGFFIREDGYILTNYHVASGANALLVTDNEGRDLFKNETELATKMRVSKFEEVEMMANVQRDGKDVLAICMNPNDYTIGADKGGAVAMFDDFDIDYNQMKYLIETRCSGALTKPKSAIVIVAASSNP